MPSQIRIDGEVYCSVREAAARAQVSRWTMIKWASGALAGNGMQITVARDPLTKQYYVAEKSVLELENRYDRVTPKLKEVRSNGVGNSRNSNRKKKI